MATSSILADRQDRRAARIAIVEEHVWLENEHDLEGVLGTFGDTALRRRALGLTLQRTRRSPPILRANDEGSA